MDGGREVGIVRRRRGAEEMVGGELEAVGKAGEAACDVGGVRLAVVVIVRAEIGERALDGVDGGGEGREG